MTRDWRFYKFYNKNWPFSYLFLYASLHFNLTFHMTFQIASLWEYLVSTNNCLFYTCKYWRINRKTTLDFWFSTWWCKLIQNPVLFWIPKIDTFHCSTEEQTLQNSSKMISGLSYSCLFIFLYWKLNKIW